MRMQGSSNSAWKHAHHSSDDLLDTCPSRFPHTLCSCRLVNNRHSRWRINISVELAWTAQGQTSQPRPENGCFFSGKFMSCHENVCLFKLVKIQKLLYISSIWNNHILKMLTFFKFMCKKLWHESKSSNSLETQLIPT